MRAISCAVVSKSTELNRQSMARTIQGMLLWLLVVAMLAVNVSSLFASSSPIKGTRGNLHTELIWLKGGDRATPEQFEAAIVNHVLTQIYPEEREGAVRLHGLSDTDEVEAFLDELISTQLNEHHIAGAGVAVVADGELLFAKGYGYADLDADFGADFESELPVIADRTLLRTDSTGKLFVWTAVMQLVEQGKVDLESDVNRYLDFQIPATFPEVITLKHLMSHSAGFDDQGYLYALDASQIETAGLWLAENMPVRVRPPGVVSAYSNYGTALAGYIVERVSGLPFEQYVEEHVFQPLGMIHSTFRQPVPAALADDVSTNYHYADGEFHAVPFTYLRVGAMGEGHTTVTDMAKFMMAHLAEGDSPILQAEILRQMHSQLFAHDPQVSGIAYGFAESRQNGQQILRHEGNNPGVSSSALFLLPEERLGVYVAYNSNGGFGPGEQFRRAFMNHYFPAEAVPPQAIPLSADQTQELTGSYRSTRIFQTTFGKVVRLLGGNYADVEVRAGLDGVFTTEGIGSTPLEWVAVEPNVLRLADGALDGQGELVFHADNADQGARLFIGNNPYRAYEKVPWYENADFQIFVLIVCELIFFLALLAFPLRKLLRKGREATSSLPVHPVMQWLIALVCFLGLLLPFGLLLTLEESLLYGVNRALIGVLTLPLLAVASTIGAALILLRNWREFTRVERVHYGTVLVATVVFVGWVNYWNLLGFRF